MTDVDFSALHVLLVDDEAFMRRLVRGLLRDLGCAHIFEAENGADGLKRLEEEGDRIGLVICDLQMPVMNGFEFVHRLRAHSDLHRLSLPVLILTGRSDAEGVRNALSLGIHGFVLKPVSRQALRERIAAALQAADATGE
ncbi:MAG: response regulator [Alphaproteobacteria bacterium]